MNERPGGAGYAAGPNLFLGTYEIIMDCALHGYALPATKNELLHIPLVESQLSPQFDGWQSEPNPKPLIREAEWGEPEQMGSLLEWYDPHNTSRTILVYQGPS
jgi:hypothetical protein